MLGLVPVLHEVCSDSRDRKKPLFLHIQTQQEIHSEIRAKFLTTFCVRCMHRPGAQLSGWEWLVALVCAAVQSGTKPRSGGNLYWLGTAECNQIPWSMHTRPQIF